MSPFCWRTSPKALPTFWRSRKLSTCQVTKLPKLPNRFCRCHLTDIRVCFCLFSQFVLSLSVLLTHRLPLPDQLCLSQHFAIKTGKRNSPQQSACWVSVSQQHGAAQKRDSKCDCRTCSESQREGLRKRAWSAKAALSLTQPPPQSQRKIKKNHHHLWQSS